MAWMMGGLGLVLEAQQAFSFGKRAMPSSSFNLYCFGNNFSH